MSNAMAEKCCGVIWNGAGYRNFICGKKGKVQRNGKWYCGRCDPDAVAARQAERHAKWDAELKAHEAKRKAERIRDARAAAFPVLVEALRDSATSLETIGAQAGRDEFLRDLTQIRGYAHSRSTVARTALDQADAIEKEQP